MDGDLHCPICLGTMPEWDYCPKCGRGVTALGDYDFDERTKQEVRDQEAYAVRTAREDVPQ